jgi:hypothetical protein
MPDLYLLQGSCHCGRIAFNFSSSVWPEKFTPRVCDCSFCQRHGALYISDPNGRLVVEIKEANALGEYQFGHKLAKFLFCRHCGVLVAVLFKTEDRIFGSVNCRCIGGNVRFGDSQIVSPQILDAERKKERWSKVMIPDVELRMSVP